MRSKKLKRIVLSKNDQTLDNYLNSDHLQSLKGGNKFPPSCYCYAGPMPAYCDVRV